MRWAAVALLLWPFQECERSAEIAFSGLTQYAEYAAVRAEAGKVAGGTAHWRIRNGKPLLAVHGRKSAYRLSEFPPILKAAADRLKETAGLKPELRVDDAATPLSGVCAARGTGTSDLEALERILSGFQSARASELKADSEGWSARLEFPAPSTLAALRKAVEGGWLTLTDVDLPDPSAWRPAFRCALQCTSSLEKGHCPECGQELLPMPVEEPSPKPRSPCCGD